ncbi:MAG: ACP S-malonyltransferase [Desulfovibrio sp.]|nr:ACP S-malonyltransferase [Desulfovibrio sp.]
MKTHGLLFPGQGSQCKGMGRALAEFDADCMDLWLLAERISRLPLRAIFWEGTDEDMRQTKALQPALTVVNCSLWKHLEGKCAIQGAAGHSLGEFSALACAHVLSIEDALTLTSLRGSLMEQADPKHEGCMAAVLKLDAKTVAALVEEIQAQCQEILVCANLNTPTQTVISGTTHAVDIACKLVKTQKGRAIALAVAAAFHSPMMEEANREFSPQLARVTWHTARFPIYGNVDGQAEVDGDRLRAKMERQMVSSVVWCDTMRAMYADGITTYLELGPKSLLGKMVAPCLPSDAPISTHLLDTVEAIQAYGEAVCGQ